MYIQRMFCLRLCINLSIYQFTIIVAIDPYIPRVPSVASSWHCLLPALLNQRHSFVAFLVPGIPSRRCSPSMACSWCFRCHVSGSWHCLPGVAFLQFSLPSKAHCMHYSTCMAYFFPALLAQRGLFPSILDWYGSILALLEWYSLSPTWLFQSSCCAPLLLLWRFYALYDCQNNGSPEMTDQKRRPDMTDRRRHVRR